jgi:hypothetical protein
MASTNSSVIFVLETNRNDGLGVVWVIMGLMEMIAFDFRLFNTWVLDDLCEPISSELYNNLELHTSFSCFSQNLWTAWRSAGLVKLSRVTEPTYRMSLWEVGFMLRRCKERLVDAFGDKDASDS